MEVTYLRVWPSWLSERYHPRQGLYVVATNNKEDVVVTRVPWAALLAELE